jgi:hypothetical protein
MANPVWEWWRLLGSAGEIGWNAPQVIQQRTMRMLDSAAGRRNGRRARAADQREFTRMFSEKLAAGQQAQWAAWDASLRLQQNWLQSWLGLLAAPTTGRLKSAGRRTARDATRVARQALAPVHRRVRSNARRLRKAP